jgi:hypothetical protein
LAVFLFRFGHEEIPVKKMGNVDQERKKQTQLPKETNLFQDWNSLDSNEPVPSQVSISPLTGTKTTESSFEADKASFAGRVGGRTGSLSTISSPF